MEFTKHDGKTIPLEENTPVTVKLRNGLEYNTNVKSFDRWIHDAKEWAGDIVGYITRKGYYSDIFRK